MNLIKLTKFTDDTDEDNASDVCVDYEYITLIEGANRGTLIHLADTVKGFYGPLWVEETVKEIRDEIAKVETNKMIDKINYQQTVDAISKDWTEDMYEKVDAKKDKVVINLSNKHLETLTESDIPEEVGENFYCQNNNLKTLEGSPKKVGESFHCSHNALTSLESSPKRVGRSFYCFNNTLTSLEGSPKEVSGNFDCSHNALTSLEGSPKKVGGNFTCFSNKLTTLKGSPKEIGGNFSCSSNSVKFTEEQVRAVCEVKGKVYV